MTITTILTRKGDHVFSVRPDARIVSVTHTLAQYRIGAVLVIGEGSSILGILSERDIVRAMASSGGNMADMTAGMLMTSDLKTVTSGTTIVSALALMTDHRIRHLPVVDGEKLVGMVSIGDLVKERLGMVEMEAESLRTYVQHGA